MRFARLTAAAVLVPLALLIVAILPTAVHSQGASVSKVAIANPVKVFNDIQETKDLNNKLQIDLNNLQSLNMKKTGELTDLKTARDNLRPESAQYQDLNKQLMEKTIEFQVWAEIQKNDLQRRHKHQIKTLYDKITAAVTKVASQRGIELVIAEQGMEITDVEPFTIEQLKAALGQRNVLYNAELADITSAVILAMDAEYRAGK